MAYSRNLIGLVASALSSTPLVAAFLAIVINIALLFLPIKGGNLGVSGGALEWVLDKLDILKHFQGSFSTGALDSAHIADLLLSVVGGVMPAVLRSAAASRSSVCSAGRPSVTPALAAR